MRRRLASGLQVPVPSSIPYSGPRIGIADHAQSDAGQLRICMLT